MAISASNLNEILNIFKFQVLYRQMHNNNSEAAAIGNEIPLSLPPAMLIQYV